MRVLLIQPPFWAINSPSIGLSYLKASLQRAGMEALIHYSNLQFAQCIGRKDYDIIQAGLPVELLFGDVVFGAALQGESFSTEGVPTFMRKALARPPSTRSVPDGLLERVHEFSCAATDFVRQFQESAPWQGWDLVGFTTTFTLVPALAMAKAMKEAGAAPPIVFGGSHCDGPLGLALMEYFPWLDFVARGDGEELIVNLANQIGSGRRDFRTIDGLVWREESHVHQASVEMARVPDLDAIPIPAYDDWLACLDLAGWKNPDNLRMPIETSRGCWYGDRRRCVFCGLNGLNDRFRSKSADRILQECDHLQRYGIPAFSAVDNVLDPHHFKDVIPRLTAREPKATWFFEVRPTHSKDQLKALEEAGIHFLQPGIESLSSRLLRLMNKGTNAFQNVRFLRWTAELGMPVFWNMLYGLPGESARDYDEITELIPSLVHLFPPLSDCNRIHVDRFSPLFDKHEAGIQPNPAYALATGLNHDGASRLAYHFEFGFDLPMDHQVVHSIEQLNRSVQGWQAQVGQAAFVSVDRGDCRWLYDTRPGAEKEESCLEGVAACIHRALDSGAAMPELHAMHLASAEDISPILQEFLGKRWIAKLDDRFLNLAVPMDEFIPFELPVSMRSIVCQVLYTEKLSRIWRLCKNT